MWKCSGSKEAKVTDQSKALIITEYFMTFHKTPKMMFSSAWNYGNLMHKRIQYQNILLFYFYLVVRNVSHVTTSSSTLNNIYIYSVKSHCTYGIHPINFLHLHLQALDSPLDRSYSIPPLNTMSAHSVKIPAFLAFSIICYLLNFIFNLKRLENKIHVITSQIWDNSVLEGLRGTPSMSHSSPWSMQMPKVR